MNQCDGCNAGLKKVGGLHFDHQGVVVMACAAHRYEEETQEPWDETYANIESDPYYRLAKVLEGALDQASGGKGKERHAKEGEPFEKQKICEIRGRVGSGYTLGQAIKKCIESKRLPKDHAIAELYGAINYIAAEVICREDEREDD